MSVMYPDEPWHLVGQMHLSAWLVPVSTAPAVDVPDVRVLRLAGRAVVAAAWVVYEPGSDLEYRELMVTVLVRQGWRVRPSVTAIWVDSPASRAGGRELWGVPKELARFQVDGTSMEMAVDDRRVGVTTALAGSLGRWPVRFSIAQRLAGRLAVTPVAVRARVRRSRTTWDGDLPGVPTSRRPLLGLSLTDVRMRFGPR
jgi:hypothetical protein